MPDDGTVLTDESIEHRVCCPQETTPINHTLRLLPHGAHQIRHNLTKFDPADRLTFPSRPRHQMERRLVGAAGAASSEDEPVEGADRPPRSPAPLLERIRRDRQDLEAKIAKLKGYISASTDMMNKLKDVPVRAASITSLRRPC